MALNKEEFKKKYGEKFYAMHGKSINEGSIFDKYVTLASMVCDEIAGDWDRTNEINDKEDKKQVYYFAMEFLPGKFLGHNLMYRGLRDTAREALEELDINLEELELQECDAALGNGGLGRLGACFLDSMASLGIAGHGCCIRYKYGLFRQKIIDGFQVELPDNWLNNGNLWEVRKSDKTVEVKFGGTVRKEWFYGRMVFIHENYETVKAVPYDIPIAGYKNYVVNTLRLWRAEAVNKDIDLSNYRRGDYLRALAYKRSVEEISKILYPDDSDDQGKLLRLKQQYFLVSAGLQSIINRYKCKHGTMDNFEHKVAVHINDTHPALCVPELMRLLIDEEGMSWDEAWGITNRVISYTNHTIMPEALEKWPQGIFSSLLPRIDMIVQEINDRFCRELFSKRSYNINQVNSMAIINDGCVHMANLAIVGSGHVNGVSRIHTEILKTQIMRNFYEYFPERFSNKTNGISHRIFLLKANPGLAALITDTIGPGWIKEPLKLKELMQYAEDLSLQEKINRVKRENKRILAKYIRETNGIDVDEDSIFDVQVKRIHAYKRQLMNVLNIMCLYNRIKENPDLPLIPRTYIFAGKAAPGYYLAKKIIKLISAVGEKINNDRAIQDKIKVVFLENYNVSLAELIIPATDVNEQISTASKEASGTGNMKFMMNGAIMIGTLDGANIEIKDAAGEENVITFGLTADQVLQYYLRGGYNAWDEYNKNTALKKVLDQLINGYFPGLNEEFREIYNSLLYDNDEFFVLKDFTPYIAAQFKEEKLFRDRNKWLKMSICNIANSGRFSSDRTIGEYAQDIWELK